MDPVSFESKAHLFGTCAFRQIVFLHPGYPDGENILLILPAVDSGGIHHETARIAYAILANCRWDGFLATTSSGEAIPQGRDESLLGQKYYFRIQDEDIYPVVPSYSNLGSLDTLPDSWAIDSPLVEPVTTDDVGRRDEASRVTTSLFLNELTNIIPQPQGEWSQHDSMSAYTANPHPSTDVLGAENATLLRYDVREMWDDYLFAIVPKAGKWVAHVLGTSPLDELETEYHNIELQSPYGMMRHFLFYRFAMTILFKSVFLDQRVTRRLVTLDSEGTPQVRNMPAHEYHDRFCLGDESSLDEDEEEPNGTWSGEEEEGERRWPPVEPNNINNLSAPDAMADTGEHVARDIEEDPTVDYLVGVIVAGRQVHFDVVTGQYTITQLE